MSEHGPKKLEVGKSTESAELEKMGQERREQLTETKLEQQPDQHTERAEQAREAISKHENQPTPAEQENKPVAHHPLLLDRALNYKQTLASLQRQLSPASKSFSKVIHQPAIEKTSEVLEQTILRPSIALGATTTAFIVGAFFYLTARHYGFALSGSEIILSLVIGAIIGLTVEALVSLLHRHIQP